MTTKTKPLGPEADHASRTAVIVLGMHRSGTSALAGLLTHLGSDNCATPMQGNAQNPKGFFESDTVRVFNDALLDSAGSTWMDWQPVNPDWMKSPKVHEFQARAQEVLRREFCASSLFVMKDPRICRLMPFWADVMASAGCTPRILHTHRHPVEVAQSLERAHGFHLSFGLLLWLRHVLDAEANTRGMTRHFTHYSAVMQDWRGMSDAAAAGLNLVWPRRSFTVDQQIDKFLESGLRNFKLPRDMREAGVPVPQAVRDTFAILERWSDAGEDQAGRNALDTINAMLSGTGQTFSGVIAAERQGYLAQRRLRDTLQETTDQKTALERALAAAQQQCTTLEQQHLAEQTALHAQIDHSAEEQAKLQSALETTRAQHQQQQTVETRQTAELATLSRLLIDSDHAVQREIASLKAAKKALTAKKADSDKQLAAARKKEKAIYASRSWRITRPIRRISRLIRRQ